MSSQKLTLSPFQEKVLRVPEAFDIFLGGGRGGGKDYAIALLILRHVEQYGARARALYLRQTYQGLSDFELICRELFGLVYGAAARFNANEHVWRFPGGGYAELGQLDSHQAYASKQGRSFTLLIVSEAGQYATPDLLDLMRSNLRGPKNMPLRMIVAANPGDVGHQWIAARYVFKGTPWKPFREASSGREFMYCPSTCRDNPFVDQDAYRHQLEASCPSDPELLRAWLEGDWTVARGAYFAPVLEESRNAVARWERIPSQWRTYLAHDFGSSAPSVTYIVAKSPGATVQEKFYPRDSLVLVDELATNEPGNLTKGMGYTAVVLAERIRELCERWKVPPVGVADDSVFSKSGHAAGSISDEFRAAGVDFAPAKKGDRITGWNVMRRLLENAGRPDVPGLYIARHCEYFWQTVPYLGRDPRRVEDVDSRGPDHAADAVRYGCLREARGMQRMVLSGV